MRPGWTADGWRRAGLLAAAVAGAVCLGLSAESSLAVRTFEQIDPGASAVSTP